MIFFWSDTHFNHSGIIRHCPATRGHFADAQDMNAWLELAWNRDVRSTDTIYLLGDFGFSHSKLEPLEAIFARLNGHKHLVVGNHDERNPKALKLPWESVSQLVTVKDHGRKVVCCHFPIESWNGAHKGYLHAHGHSHGTLKNQRPHRFDVGADVFPGPVSMDRLFELAAGQAFKASDHHGDL